MMQPKAKNTRNFFSKPQPVELPNGFPFFVFISAVELPRGCLPPSNRLRHRIAVGRGSSPDHAFRLTQMEAIERYSLQFDVNKPKTLWATQTFGDAYDSCDAKMLYLGHPDSDTAVNSTGSAAGDDIEAASIRAVLELVERFTLENEEIVWNRVSPDMVGSISSYSSWLKDLGRTIFIRIHSIEEQIFVASVACTDSDGGRPTEGSAADVSLDDAVRRACEEAILSRRNMIQLEMNAMPIRGFPEDERQVVNLYRGVTPSPFRGGMNLNHFEKTKSIKLEQDIRKIVEVSLSVLGSGLALFDLTDNGLGVPVVRAIARKGR